jgi:signal transduction histidine kinase
MAWTWSAPQRGTVAGAQALSFGHKALYRAAHHLAHHLGRGDAVRGLSLGCAAFLTITGTAVPLLAPVTLTAILFLAGAALVLYAATAPATARTLSALEQPETALHPRSSVCLQELLTSQPSGSACDRAAFARLTAHMSHELRTPLNAILGFSELMSNEVFGPLGSSCYAAYARDIHASGISLLKSADDALAITSLLTATDQHHRSATAHVASAAAEALAFHTTGFASRGITARCTIDTEAEILADAQAVRQLLINLIADASQRAEPDASLSLASRQDNGYVEILITISGQIKTPASMSDSFSMLLARTLGQLSSAQIIDDQAAASSSEWHVAVRFQHAAQNDFFNVARNAT